MTFPIQSRDFFAIELSDAPEPFQAAEYFAHLPHMLLMESSMRHSKLGRYSFLMADPVEWFKPLTKNLSATFSWLDSRIEEFPARPIPDLPPFQGGVAGLFGYELNSAIEAIPGDPYKESSSPVALGVYDVVLAWDHERDVAWMIASGYPETSQSKREMRAKERARYFCDLLCGKPIGRTSGPSIARNADEPRHQRTPGFPCSGHVHLTSNFQHASFIETIQKALAYIHAGDVFQVNIAQQLNWPASADSLELYKRLRVCNPSTFSAFFDTGPSQVISASPERLVSVQNGRVESRPIKGTRRRTLHPEVDIDVAQQLLTSEKDRAENVMIVDLIRNDLSRICNDDSVRVTQFVELESYASVLHLVSAIEGVIRKDVTASQLLRAVFPGGSVTGAPKVRAMEIISELEPSPRGPYCGSIGYFGFDGNIDLNILIRTITAENGSWNFPVGGGIVADSDPQAEFEETWTKASGMLAAVSDFVPELVGTRQ